MQRAHVIGHSYGAVTALQLACEAPSAVHSLVLLEPPKTTEETGRLEVFEPLIAKYRSGDARGAVDSFMALVGGPDWRIEVRRTVPGGPEQAETDAATFFDVELPVEVAGLRSAAPRGLCDPRADLPIMNDPQASPTETHGDLSPDDPEGDV